MVPPKPAREFRGMWIATVANIDWPSKPGLSTSAQKAELISILDRAAKLKLNAVIFQVRPACDAFYASRIEPWSEYLTGTMGKAPQPFYDPLQFAITEAHKRGLELHAWFNPYRALHKSHTGKIAPNHISRTHPEFVKKYGNYLWLDPGEPAVQDYSLSVVMDVVKRYDVDGVHFDDYFYPDESDGGGAEFPDSATWKKYGAGGKLNFEDWRRENVNRFIKRVYDSIKAAKPWVKFGVSPHGIWRPGNPPQIKGFDSYSRIFADSRKWLANGWVDYFSPQIYWRIGPKEQSFPVLLNWWSEQNVKHRHLWPGIAAYRAGDWGVGEIQNQIQLTRKQNGATGYVLYNAGTIMRDAGLDNLLRRENSDPALVPASPWLSRAPPAKPAATITGSGENLKLTWSSKESGSIRWWLVQRKIFSDWKTEIFPADVFSKMLGTTPEAIAVTAIDRFGNASAPCVLQPSGARKIPVPGSHPRLLQKW
ncbi:MAG TPA: family 10 glycosylhydrolase [Verrucomicrobiae bacterium]|nr:family 10 glycosylhydrolase [Verrucomicrobiae bacterium]